MKPSALLSRFSLKIGLSVALAMSVVSFAVPARVHAQEAAPVAAQAAQPAEHNSAAPAAGEKKAESSAEEENNAFRHTPLVQSLARVFHLPVETTATLFEILNFAIIFFGIAIPLVRVMPKVIRKRSQSLKADLEEARKVSEDAKTRLGAVEAKLASLDQEIAAIRSEVESEAKGDEARIKAALGEESNRIVAAAEQEISAAAAHARRGLRTFAADLAIEQASRQLNLTPETDRALIAEFVSSAASTAKGAEN